MGDALALHTARLLHSYPGYPIAMTYSVLLSGMGFGLLVAAPVGPMALLCIARTLRDGALAGLATGLGIATADGLFAAVTAFGIAIATDALREGWPALQIVGGAFLVIVAIRSLRAAGTTTAQPPSGGSSFYVFYLGALGLTLTNPATLLIFSAMFASMANVSATSGAPALLTLGVFLGSILWWMVLVTLTAGLRQRLRGAPLKWITTLAALGLAAFGAFMIFRAAATMLE